MARFVTETPQMQAASRHVTDVNADIARLLSSLRAEVSTAPAHFKGAASATFGQLMIRYDMDAKKLNDALAAIAEQISAAGRTYEARDTAQSDMLRSSGSGLNM